jgi:hypothetical protein
MELKALLFDIDLFQINYTIYQDINIVNKEKQDLYVKWEILLVFDVSTNNLCSVTMEIIKQINSASLFTHFGDFNQTIIVCLIILSFVSAMLNVMSLLKLARVFTSIHKKYVRSSTKSMVSEEEESSVYIK